MKQIASLFSPGLRSAFDAALIMAIGMGFGRFAYTAIYPHMVEEGLLDLQAGSLAASANYAGYLLGAILAIWARPHHAHRLCLWSTAGTVACLALLAVVDAVTLIVVLRGLAGIFSALAMVAASLWLLAHRGQMHRAPLLYAGVGIGIALSAELLAAGAQFGLHSQGLWLLLGVVALVLGLIAAPGLMTGGPANQNGAASASSFTPNLVKPLPLVAIYGLAGFGYIITATYLPLLVKSALPDMSATQVWAVFGLSAVPSCFLWHYWHRQRGTRAALTANLLVQAIGVALPIVWPGAAGYLLSAVLVGGSFLGTVTISMPAAQRIASQGRGSLMATMTVVYSIGQILGPLVASGIFAMTHILALSLLAATAALLVGVALSLFRL